MSLKDTVLRHIARLGAQENPALKVDQESGWIERIEPERPIRPAAGKRATAPDAPVYREKFHKKTGRQAEDIAGHDTYSLALIWPEAAKK